MEARCQATSAPFPRAAASFVGRVHERARLAALLESETVALIYGVAGIGKTELAYQAVADLRRSARFAPARALIVRVAPGMGQDELVTALALSLGAKPGRGADPEQELAAVIHALESEPAIVCLDDLHHLEPQALGTLLAALGRHVAKSRILGTSRHHVPVPDGGLPLAQVHLAPLAPAELEELGARIAALSGLPAQGGAELYRRTAGSPFRALRALAAGPAPAGDEALTRELAALPQAVRELLLGAALAGGKLRPDELGASADAVAVATRRFLLDPSRGGAHVHDLVRDTLLEWVAPAEVGAVRERVAEALLARRAPGADGPAPLDVAHAIHELVHAGEHARAFAELRRRGAELAAAGVAHLVTEPLRELRRALPDERLAIDLITARVLLGRSRVAEARALLTRALGTPAGRRSIRLRLLLATALERAGRLRRAEAVLRDGLTTADAPGERFQLLVELATVTALRGEGNAARAVLAEARRARPRPTAHERRHFRYALAVSWLYEERYAEAARAADAAVVSPTDLLGERLALLGIPAYGEIDDVDGARRSLEVAHVESDQDPAHAAYEGVVLWAAGDLPAARAKLERHLRGLEAHADRTFALMAGHYLALTLLGLGEPDAARRVLDRLVARAREAEMTSTVLHNQALAALAAVDGGHALWARREAQAVLRRKNLPVRARLLALLTHARLAALEGDLSGARAFVARGEHELPARERAGTAGLIAIERAELELLGGDPGLALAQASSAAAHFAVAGRGAMELRALAAQALALVATGDEGDRLLAARVVAAARSRALAASLAPVLARLTVADAALARAGGDPALADALLGAALAQAAGPAAALDTQLLRAARARLMPPGLPAGIEALARALGFRGGPPLQVVGRAGLRVPAGENALARLSDHDLVIDLDRARIAAPGTGKSLRGRPVACALLARLVDGDPGATSPETLYREVWRGPEYHALRHRNTVYVGMSRLRRALEEILPGRAVIETEPGGFRLADGVRAAVLRAGPMPDGPAVLGAEPRAHLQSR